MVFTPRARAAHGFTLIEVAVAVAILGSLFAVAVPAFVRELHASRFHEPIDGLSRLSTSALAYAAGRPIVTAFPVGAPLTPATPPRGKPAADPPGVWDQPTWQALGFRAAPEGIPHSFAFGFDSYLSPRVSRFTAHAHADLNGDGNTSTFEVRGQIDPSGSSMEPGMFVQGAVE